MSERRRRRRKEAIVTSSGHLQCPDCRMKFEDQGVLDRHRTKFCIHSKDAGIARTAKASQGKMSFAQVQQYLDSEGMLDDAGVGNMSLAMLRRKFQENEEEVDEIREKMRRKIEAEKLEALKRLKGQHVRAKVERETDHKELKTMMNELYERKEQEMRMQLEVDKTRQRISALEGKNLMSLETKKQRELDVINEEQRALKAREERLLEEISGVKEKVDARRAEEEERQAHLAKLMSERMELNDRLGITQSKEEQQRLELALKYGDAKATVRENTRTLEAEQQQLEKQLAEVRHKRQVFDGPMDPDVELNATELAERGLDVLVETLQDNQARDEHRLRRLRKRQARADKHMVTDDVEDLIARQGEGNWDAMASSSSEEEEPAPPIRVRNQHSKHHHTRGDSSDRGAHGGERPPSRDNHSRSSQRSLPPVRDIRTPDHKRHRRHHGGGGGGDGHDHHGHHHHHHQDQQHAQQHQHHQGGGSGHGQQLQLDPLNMSQSQQHYQMDSSAAYPPGANPALVALQREIQALKQQYMAQGGNNPQLLATIQGLEAEAQKILFPPPPPQPQVPMMQPLQQQQQQQQLHPQLVNPYASPLPAVGASGMIGAAAGMGGPQMAQLQRIEDENRKLMDELDKLSRRKEQSKVEEQARKFEKSMQMLTRKLAGGGVGGGGGGGGAIGGGGGGGELAAMHELEINEAAIHEQMERLPPDSELYQVYLDHLTEVTKARFKIQKMAQEARLYKAEQEARQLKEDEERRRAAREFELAQQEAIMAARYRQLHTKELAPSNAPIEQAARTAYDPLQGLIVYLDYVVGLERKNQYIQIVYAFFEGKERKTPIKALPVCECEPDGTTNRCILALSRPFAKVQPSPNLRLLLEVQVILNYMDLGPSTVPRLESLAWTELPLFSANRELNHQKPWRLPMFRPPVTPGSKEKILRVMPRKLHHFMFVRLAAAQDAEFHNSWGIAPALVGSKYVVPPLLRDPKQDVEQEEDDGEDDDDSDDSRRGGRKSSRRGGRNNKGKKGRKGRSRKGRGRGSDSDDDGSDSDGDPFVRRLGGGPTMTNLLDAKRKAKSRGGSKSRKGSRRGRGRGRSVDSEAYSDDYGYSDDDEEEEGVVTSLSMALSHVEGFEDLDLDLTRPHKVYFLLYNGTKLVSDKVPTTTPKKGHRARSQSSANDMTNAKFRHVSPEIRREFDLMSCPWSPGTFTDFKANTNTVVVVALIEEVLGVATKTVAWGFVNTHTKASGVLSINNDSHCTVDLYKGDIDMTKGKQLRQQPKAPESKAVIALYHPDEPPLDVGERYLDTRKNQAFLPYTAPKPSNLKPYSKQVDGIDFYVDGVRYLPDDTGCLKLSYKFWTPTGKPMTVHALPTVTGPLFSPMFGRRTELHEPNIDPQTLVIVSLTLCSTITRKTHQLGWTAINLFTDMQGNPVRHSTGSEVSVNQGAFQLQLYGGGADLSDSLDVRTMATEYPRVPCVTVLVRVVRAPLKSNGLSVIGVNDVMSEAQERMGVLQPMKGYALGHYDTTLASPTPNELILYNQRQERADSSLKSSLQELVEILPRNHTQGLEQDPMKWMRSYFQAIRAQDPYPFTGFAPYQSDVGLTFTVRSAQGLPKKGVPYKCIFSASPPGSFYQLPVSTSNVHYTVNHVFTAPQLDPVWRDPARTLRLPDDVRTVIVVEVRAMVKKNKQWVSGTTERVGWTLVDAFTDDNYINIGTHICPLYRFPIPDKFLYDVSQKPANQILAQRVQNKLVRHAEWASVTVNIGDPRVNALLTSYPQHDRISTNVANKYVPKKGPPLSNIVDKGMDTNLWQKGLNVAFQAATGITTYN